MVAIAATKTNRKMMDVQMITMTRMTRLMKNDQDAKF